MQSLGLERHADAFEQEEVELDVVSTLSDADLLALGVHDAGAAATAGDKVVCPRTLCPVQCDTLC